MQSSQVSGVLFYTTGYDTQSHTKYHKKNVEMITSVTCFLYGYRFGTDGTF